MDEETKFLVKLFAAAVGVIVTVMLTARQAERYFDRLKCSSYQTATNRDTKFVDYNFVHWDCLTPSKDGKYISTSNLRDITD